MKHLSKSLLAVALLAASAGAANASIKVGDNTLSEAWLSVYDSSQKLTFNLDLGLLMGDLVTNINDANFERVYDLNAITATAPDGTKWSDFAANLDASKTSYGVIVSGLGNKLLATGPAIVPAKFAITSAAGVAVINIQGHVSQINTGAGYDNPGVLNNFAANLSSVIADSDAGNIGQFNKILPLNTLYGGKSDAKAEIKYGEAANFYYYPGALAVQTAAQQWSLVGSTLTYSAPVPLPAAVWMFGAGLMGVLGLTRRKNAAL